jgi:2,4-dienoyl-CoA reductase-like NADH-dependent reductase (Old Yellow Enzyme family)
MPHLFDPLTIKSITLKNRIGVSPMCQYSSENGHATDWHLVHLGTRAIGGAALVIAEATAISSEGRITPGDAGLWQDSQIEPLARITKFIKQHGAVPGIQIAHAGRKASSALPWEGGQHLDNNQGGWDIVGPTDTPFGGNQMKKPIPLDKAGIKKVITDFRATAQRAKDAGYQWLELHAAHGYLMHSFLSPLTNTRTDEYGGDLKGRARLLLEVTKAVQEVWPENLPLSVRLSATDWVEGGWTSDDSVALATLLKDAGIDLIDCSSGALRAEDAKAYPVGAGYQVPLAEAVKRGTGILTAAVGMITEPMQADQIIRNGQADMIYMARELLRNPYWPIQAAKTLHQKDAVKLPVQYARA